MSKETTAPATAAPKATLRAISADVARVIQLDRTLANAVRVQANGHGKYSGGAFDTSKETPADLQARRRVQFLADGEALTKKLAEWTRASAEFEVSAEDFAALAPITEFKAQEKTASQERTKAVKTAQAKAMLA